jgi:hypothetical protein
MKKVIHTVDKVIYTMKIVFHTTHHEVIHTVDITIFIVGSGSSWLDLLPFRAALSVINMVFQELKVVDSIYCFTSRSRICHLYGDVTIAGEGLQNLA